MSVPVLDGKVAAERAFVQAATRLPTLFDLDDQSHMLLRLLEAVADQDDAGQVAELESQLALIDQMLIEKCEGYVSVIRTLEAMAEARKAEADRLATRAKTAQRGADWLKNRLLVHMKGADRERIEMARFTVSLRQNPPAVNVVDAAAVPHEFERTTITTTVDKRAILDHYKGSGEVIPGVEITRAERVVIA